MLLNKENNISQKLIINYLKRTLIKQSILIIAFIYYTLLYLLCTDYNDIIYKNIIII